MRAAELEKTHGERESLDRLLSHAVEHCPHAQDLWLMAAKEKWLAGDVTGARRILEGAFVVNPSSEKIWLAAVKLEAANGELSVAKQLLQRAREVADTERIWMKSAGIERQLGSFSAALDILKAAIQRYPHFAKLYMIQAYAAGVKSCPQNPTLWILASRLEESQAGKNIRARSLLEKARNIIPSCDTLWAEAVDLEERAGSHQQALTMLSRGLQACPCSGLLWTMAIWAEPRPARKSRSADALRKSNNGPLVMCTVARLFWEERKIEKARSWFERAIEGDPDFGDCWGWWLKFEQQHGTQEQQQQVVQACVKADPHRSPVWQSVAKDQNNLNKSTADILRIVAETLR